jgi:ATP-dependent HslUV protease subunit HslV
VISGNGDVIEPEHNLIAIGSGGPLPRPRPWHCSNTELGARDIVEKGLSIAADICIYTNQQRTIEQLDY